MAYTPDTLATMGPDGLMVKSAPATDPTVMRIWTYVSGDAMTSIRADNYFSDAAARGMSENDVVFAMTTSGGAPSTLYVTAVISVDSSGADLADGSSMTLTNS